MTGTASVMQLDYLFPRWKHRERHRLAVAAPREVVLRAVQEVTWAEVPVARALMYIRGFGRFTPSGSPILDTMASLGFRILDRTEDEIVVGEIRPVGRGSNRLAADLFGEEFRDFAQPEYVKIGFNFRYDHGLLSTETRVWPIGRRARCWFRLYWAIIRPYSGLIRRVWLHAIGRRALSSA